MRTISLAIVVLLGLLTACGPAPEQIPFSLDQQVFVLEGPLFAGANSGQIEVTPALATYLDAQGYAQLKGARLTGVTLRVADTLSFDLCEEMALQAVADAAEMQQLAILNPVPQGQQAVSLQPAAEASLLPYFEAGTFYLVLDANLADDLDDNLVIEADLQFELDVTK